MFTANGHWALLTYCLALQTKKTARLGIHLDSSSASKICKDGLSTCCLSLLAHGMLHFPPWRREVTTGVCRVHAGSADLLNQCSLSSCAGLKKVLDFLFLRDRPWLILILGCKYASIVLGVCPQLGLGSGCRVNTRVSLHEKLDIDLPGLVLIGS